MGLHQKILLTVTAMLAIVLAWRFLELERRIHLLENAVYGKIPAAELAKKNWPVEGD